MDRRTDLQRELSGDETARTELRVPHGVRVLRGCMNNYDIHVLITEPRTAIHPPRASRLQ